jgi:hypothetical protein
VYPSRGGLDESSLKVAMTLLVTGTVVVPSIVVNAVTLILVEGSLTYEYI